jgi:hypothetical protein
VLETKWMLGIDRHQVSDIGAKLQARLLGFTLQEHFDRQKWRVVDLDPDLFDWRDQDIPLALTAQDRRK